MKLLAVIVRRLALLLAVISMTPGAAALVPVLAAAAAAGKDVVTAVSTQQYTLAGSDGTTWQPMDPTKLSMSVSPGAASQAVIVANVDLWTWDAGFNQDVAVFVDGSLAAWKESGGFAGTFSPNAATVAVAVPLSPTSHTVELRWKTNRPDPTGKISAGAGPIGPEFSPTRLTATLVPTTDATSVASVVSTQQYSLAGSDGTTWQPMDPAKLSMSVSSAAASQAVVMANVDLWTWDAGFNQDVAVFVDGSLAAWKESGGFAGTFSPNAATVVATIPLSPGSHTVDLRWKANKADPVGKISAGAGPIGAEFSPTQLIATLVPTTDSASVASAVSTEQYTLAASDGTTWQPMDVSKLSMNLSPAVGVQAVIVANVDLWTWDAGFNQDVAVFVDGSREAWKESGGFAGTFSPNAATVAVTIPLGPGSHTVDLRWKTNRPDPTGKISAGAGPIGGEFSPTRLTATMVPTSAPSWRTAILSPAATHPVSEVRLADVSCPSSTSACVAVGQYNDNDTADRALVETLDGGAWALTAPELPPGTTSSNLAGVSCPTSTTCFAVGSAADANGRRVLVESMTGGTWAPTTPDMPAHTLYAALRGVSCPTATACVAVGTSSDPTGDHALVETMAGGTWAPTAPAVPAGTTSATLASVACPTAITDCVAVGSSTDASGIHPLVMTLAGGTWTTVAASGPTGGELNHVSCPAATTACVAVGQYFDVSTHPLVETLEGGTWAATVLDLPADTTNASLSSVSCPTAPTSCVAVGYRTGTGSTGNRPLVESLAGGAWAPSTADLPAGATYGALKGVSCPATIAACVAAGYAGGTGVHSLVETLSGSAWTPTVLPEPAVAYESFDGTSCPVPGGCVAVGKFSGPTGTHALVETLTGGSWAPTIPDVPTTSYSSLRSVSCPTAITACVAVGQYYDGTGGHALVETLAGGTWTATTLDFGANAGLQGVSCPTATTACVAVGQYYDGTGSHALVETLAGGSWTPTALPVAGASDADLTSVSCPTVTTACVAVGSYLTAASHGLVETLAGGTWTQAAVSGPAGSTDVQLRGVSCPATTAACIAVGEYDEGGAGHGLIETLAGGTWAPTTLSVPAQTAYSNLSSVSCPVATTACVSVGHYFDGTTGVHPLVVTLAGGAWSDSRPGVPPATNDASLEGVSCAGSVDACWAVGGALTGKGDQLGLAATNALP